MTPEQRYAALVLFAVTFAVPLIQFISILFGS